MTWEIYRCSNCGFDSGATGYAVDWNNLETDAQERLRAAGYDLSKDMYDDYELDEMELVAHVKIPSREKTVCSGCGEENTMNCIASGDSKGRF
jgi:predicted RNA-binding Zn-ribbon protein involved in translation (DUF1610 family)